MSEKAEPITITIYERCEDAPLHIQKRALSLAEWMEIDEEEKWSIMHQGYKDLVGLNKEREAAHPTKQDLIDAIADTLPSFLSIEEGQWNEYTGTLLLSEDQWGRILESAQELQALLKKFEE